MDDEQLWQGYTLECQSHLEEIETFLAEIGDDLSDTNPFRGSVDTVFRSYHSLKGISTAMGVEGVAGVAHVCEDILGLVRAGDSAIDLAAYRHLFNGYEALREGVGEAVSSRGNVATNHKLIATLKEEYGRLRDMGLHAEDTQDGGADLNDDGGTEDEELLGIFCETAREQLDEISACLTEGDDAAVLAQFVDSIESLAEGANMLDMAEVVDMLRGFIPTLQDPRAALSYFEEHIRPQFQLLFEIADMPPWLAVSTDRIIANLVAHKTILSDTLDRYAQEGKKETDQTTAIMDVLEALTPVLSVLSGQFNGVGLSQLSETVDVFYDVCLRMAAGKVTIKEDVIAVFQEYHRVISSLDEDGLDAVFLGLHASVAKIDNVIRYILDRSDTDSSDEGGISAFDIHESYQFILTQEQVNDVLAETAAHKNLMGFQIFPERDHEIAKRFLEWFEKEIHVVTNRTLFENNETGFEFLFIAKHSLEHLEKEILAIDPDRAIIRSLSLFKLGQPAQAIDFLERRLAADGGKGKAQEVQFLRIPATRIEELIDLVQVLLRSSYVLDETLVQYDRQINQSGQILRDVLAFLPNTTSSLDDKGQQLIADWDTHLLNARSANRDAKGELISIRRRLNDIFQTCTDMSLIPMGQLLSRLARGIRISGEDLGKKVNTKVMGDQVNVDRTLFQVISECLTHIVRNALDHGLEMPDERVKAGKSEVGLITISILSRGEEIWLEVTDDGKGIDRKKVADKAIGLGVLSKKQAETLTDNDLLELIARSSFSMAEEVTTMSGRGVGMDVVFTSIKNLGGTILFSTELGKGTNFKLRIPLQSTMQQLLLFQVGDMTYGLQALFVRKIINNESLSACHHLEHVEVEGQYVQALDLDRMLNNQEDTSPQQGSSFGKSAVAIGLSSIDKLLIVDYVIGQRHIYLQQNNVFFSKLPYIQKAAVVGVNDIVLILDAFKLLGDANTTAGLLQMKEA